MTPATRTEEDLLGAREVPLEAYWGIHTLRATENYRMSATVVGDEPAFVRGMVQVKKASALANRELGTLTPEVADAIVWACDQILEVGRCLDQFPIDVFQGGAGTSVNMNTNEVVANLARASAWACTRRSRAWRPSCASLSMPSWASPVNSPMCSRWGARSSRTPFP